ncbi:MAG: hypothetical protein B9S32_00565 [Verrucomicrobia bacterium Tous-C9LFEB]|nr:MAG: hypothetical protein B9S32_00565 [Verrucomicrobia bacterium Tous-C9LFEB]
MPELSVILSTHNPRPDHLEATLRGLAAQTLPRERWELLIVDSASTPPLAADRARPGHPEGRVVREEIPGLTPARLRGIAETATPLIVFVDDDNVLNPDYLERALALSAKWPDLGVWGGQTIGRYEEEPAEWLQPWCWIAVREFERDEWSNSLDDARAVPFGAGMCVRRSVADFYRKAVGEDPLRRRLDRTGTSLGGGGDNDIVFTACKMGLGRGLFRELKLQHLIPAQRVQPEYLLNLVRSTTCSYQILLHLHHLPITAEKKWTWWQRWNRLRHVAPRERPFILAQHDGQVRATELIASSMENPVQPVKNFRAFEQTPLRWTGESKSVPYSTAPARKTSSAVEPLMEARRKVAAQLTQQMEATPGFTYLRLGDGELRMLLAHQNRTWTDREFKLQQRPSVNISVSNPGLQESDMPRLLQAYEQATWLDLYDSFPYNREHLPELKLERAPGGTTNPTPDTSKIFIDWTWHEMGGYLARHRCLFCGSEAALLKALYELPEYRQIAKRFWPESAPVFFQQTRRDGKHLSEDLDLIKADIAADIDRLQIDTVFLALAGAAKILAHDLAKQKGVRAFDFGSMIRALTYSGSDGHAAWRSAHYPFLVRVPFELYMRALQTANPEIDPVTLISKAHAQLTRELVHQEPLQFAACDTDLPSAYDPSRENLQHFYESYAVYRRHYYPWAKKRPETRPLLREFRQWRFAKGLGLDGRLYQFARTLYRRIIPTSPS